MSILEYIISNKNYSQKPTWTEGTTSSLLEDYGKILYKCDANETSSSRYISKTFEMEGSINESSYITTGGYGTTSPTTSAHNLYYESTSSSITSPYSEWVSPKRTFTEEELQLMQQKRMRDILRSRSAPAFIMPSHRRPLVAARDEKEERARDTLKRVIGEQQWRSFLRNGFVSVKGRSGKVYLLYPGHEMTIVMEQGKVLEKLCIVLSGSFPPTDALIMRYLLILNDEVDFRARSHVWTAGRLTRFQRVTAHSTQPLALAVA